MYKTTRDQTQKDHNKYMLKKWVSCNDEIEFLKLRRNKLSKMHTDSLYVDKVILKQKVSFLTDTLLKEFWIIEERIKQLEGEK